MGEVERIAKGLSEAERDIAISLLGNSWQGQGRPTPGIAIMNRLGLMHIDALKRQDGSFLRFKARPLRLGCEVRDYLLRHPDA